MESLFETISIILLTTTITIFGLIFCIKRSINRYEIRRIKHENRNETIKFLPENYYIQQMNGSTHDKNIETDSRNAKEVVLNS